MNLFAGQLYCKDLADYEALKGELAALEEGGVERTLGFVKAWVGIRRKGQEFGGTHMGFLVDGRAVKEGAFE